MMDGVKQKIDRHPFFSPFIYLSHSCLSTPSPVLFRCYSRTISKDEYYLPRYRIFFLVESSKPYVLHLKWLYISDSLCISDSCYNYAKKERILSKQDRKVLLEDDTALFQLLSFLLFLLLLFPLCQLLWIRLKLFSFLLLALFCALLDCLLKHH